MSDIVRPRNGAVLAKEQTDDTFAQPADSDFIRTGQPQLNFNPQTTNADEVGPSLDTSVDIVGGIQTQITLPVFLRGSGEPGTRPAYDLLMRICGLEPTVLSTDITGTDISVDGANSEFVASSTDLSALTVGTVFHVQGYSNDANNGAFLVTANSSGSVTVTKPDGSAPGLVDEAEGPSVTLRYGIAGTTASDGTTTSLTLADPFAATEDAYAGMPVVLSSNPSTPVTTAIGRYGADRVAELAEIMSSTLDSSTVASVPPLVRYAPVTKDPANAPKASLEVYADGVVYTFLGARGTISFTMTPGQTIQAQVQLSAVLAGPPEEAPVPSFAGFVKNPPIFRDSRMTVGQHPAALNSYSVDLGNNVVFDPNPNSPQGFDQPIITQRSTTGSVDPRQFKPQTQNLLKQMQDGERRIVHGRASGGRGAQPGERIGITVQRAVYNGYSLGNRNNVQTEQMSFEAEGQDNGIYLVND